MTNKSTKAIVNHRNAVNGQFVTKEYVKTHKGTTTTEHNPHPAPAKRSKTGSKP